MKKEQSPRFDIWEEIIFMLKIFKYKIEDWKYRCNKYKHAKKSLRRGFAREFQMGLKEEFLFISGLLLGAISGLLGNFFITVYFKWVDKTINDFIFFPICIAFIFSMILFVGWFFKVFIQMKKEYYRTVWNSREYEILHPWKQPKPTKSKAYKVHFKPKPPIRKK